MAKIEMTTFKFIPFVKGVIRDLKFSSLILIYLPN